jgi:RimJ/RimL family protein N-acetyltransferase
LRPGSLASVDSVLCILRIAFDSLQLKRVWCRTVAENVRVVSFHDSAGLVRTGRSLTGDVHGVRQEMVEHELTLAGWDAVRLALETQAARMARMLTR